MQPAEPRENALAAAPRQESMLGSEAAWDGGGLNVSSASTASDHRFFLRIDVGDQSQNLVAGLAIQKPRSAVNIPGSTFTVRGHCTFKARYMEATVSLRVLGRLPVHTALEAVAWYHPDRATRIFGYSGP